MFWKRFSLSDPRGGKTQRRLQSKLELLNSAYSSDVTDIAETSQWEIAHFPQNTRYLGNFLAIMIGIIVLEVLDIYNPTAKLKLRMNSIRNWAKTVSGTALADEMSVDLGSDIGEKTAAVSDNNFQLVHQIFLKLHTSIFKPLISNQVSQFLKLRPRLWAISDQQSRLLRTTG